MVDILSFRIYSTGTHHSAVSAGSAHTDESTDEEIYQNYSTSPPGQSLEQRVSMNITITNNISHFTHRNQELSPTQYIKCNLTAALHLDILTSIPPFLKQFHIPHTSNSYFIHKNS